jgi:hypothetical protein
MFANGTFRAPLSIAFAAWPACCLLNAKVDPSSALSRIAIDILYDSVGQDEAGNKLISISKKNWARRCAGGTR